MTPRCLRETVTGHAVENRSRGTITVTICATIPSFDGETTCETQFEMTTYDAMMLADSIFKARLTLFGYMEPTP